MVITNLIRTDPESNPDLLENRQATEPSCSVDTVWKWFMLSTVLDLVNQDLLTELA